MKEEKFDKNINKTDEYDRYKSIQELSSYKVDDTLKAKGYKYDEARVFIPYTYKNLENPDCRDIYLAISRHATEECRISYYWCKRVDGVFYAIEKFIRDKLPCEEANDFNSTLSRYGIEANLDSTKGSYKEFAEQFIKDISQANCLDILKDKDFDFMETYYFGDDDCSHCPDLVELNRCDMRNLVRKVFDCEPVKVYERKYLPDYELIHCILHDDENPSASVYKHVYICKGCNPPVKLDQFNLIKKAFGVENMSEVINIFTSVF
ncbi:MAG: hypothetical protein ACI389_06170 [Methanobrevibacter sp.]|uniref:hypothetical protein n=1 Tax=Methanobrevibacter sp. TaxID=66852 RepID=UPI003F07DC98